MSENERGCANLDLPPFLSCKCSKTSPQHLGVKLHEGLCGERVRYAYLEAGIRCVGRQAFLVDREYPLDDGNGMLSLQRVSDLLREQVTA